MVLEQYFKIGWLETKSHAFYIAIIYTLIGVISARLIFPNDVGLMSLAFISILLIPSLGVLLQLEENIEIRERKFSMKLLFRDHLDIIKVYFFLFFGCLMVFLLISLIFPTALIGDMFFPQFRAANIVGSAVSVAAFKDLVVNNSIVFLVAFLLSFIYGSGAILFLVWNASVWGIAFGFTARDIILSGTLVGFNTYFSYFPHMIIEGTAYLFAAVVGGVVSKAVLREKLFSRKFNHIVTDALMLLAIGFFLVLLGGIIESQFFA
ncbi:MAG TPA: stage II sporulation protein M [Candidatus Nanoarchaeia archaeon]|nr:stage II sporulation protein M [Candidatus Nanoarchaeia archaeon]